MISMDSYLVIMYAYAEGVEHNNKDGLGEFVGSHVKQLIDRIAELETILAGKTLADNSLPICLKKYKESQWFRNLQKNY